MVRNCAMLLSCVVVCAIAMALPTQSQFTKEEAHQKVRLAYVTGGTGCVGRNLVQELVERNWEVVVLHRKSSDLSRLDGCEVGFGEVDLHDLESVRRGIPTGVDALFHVAGNTSHWAREREQQWKDNVLATRHLANVALEKEVERFIFTSTGATLSYQAEDERLAMKIQNSYIRTKRLAELEVYKAVARGLDAVFLHPAIVVGAYDYNSYSQIFTQVSTGVVNFAFPGSIVFCHAKDVAIGHIRAFEKGRSCERYVLGGPYASWQEVFQKIADRVNPESKIMVAPRSLLKILARAHVIRSFFTRRKPMLSPDLVSLLEDGCEVQVYDKKKVEELGYRSASLDQMVDDCYQWLLKAGMLKN